MGEIPVIKHSDYVLQNHTLPIRAGGILRDSFMSCKDSGTVLRRVNPDILEQTHRGLLPGLSFEDDPLQYVERVMDIVFGKNGFHKFRGYGVSLPEIAFSKAGDGEYYVVVEDLSKRNGCVLGDIDVANAGQRLIDATNRAYDSLIHYALDAWYQSQEDPFLFDACYLRQLFFDEDSDEIILFDLDPIFTIPSLQPKDYGQRLYEISNKLMLHVNKLLHNGLAKNGDPITKLLSLFD